MRGSKKTAQRKVQKYEAATDRLIYRSMPGLLTSLNDANKKSNMREDIVEDRSSGRVVDRTADRNRGCNTTSK